MVALTPPGGRLSLVSSNATPTTDITGVAASSVYYVPDAHEFAPSFSSTLKGMYSFGPAVSLALTGLTANTNYDIFLYFVSNGTAQLSATAWTNDTTRAAPLVRWTVGGGGYSFLVDNNTSPRLYVGTIRTAALGQSEDSVARRYVWNMYNRKDRRMKAYDSGANYAYTTAAFRELRGGSTPGVSRVEFVTGLAEDSIVATAMSQASNSTIGIPMILGIGLDGTSTSVGFQSTSVSSVASHPVSPMSSAVVDPQLGRHFLCAMEYSQATGTCTWSPNNSISNLFAQLRM